MDNTLFCLTEHNNKNDWSDAIAALQLDRLLNMSSDFLAYFITEDEQEITQRQIVFRDCINNPRISQGVGKLLERISDIKEIREKMRIYSKDMERTLYSVRVIEMYLDAISTANDLYEGVYSSLDSERLKNFLLAFHEVFISDGYKEIETYTQKCYRSAQTVKSFTVGINLNARFEPVEMGIISMNDKEFVTSNFFVDLFDTKDNHLQHVTPFVSFNSKNQLLERSMYLTMNDCLCRAVTKAFRDVLAAIDDITRQLLGAEQELRFLYYCCGYLSELQFKRAQMCFPVVSKNCSVVENAVSPILLLKMNYNQIIPNDIRFDRNGKRVYILTGANSGGKSVYIDTIGIMQVLFQLGLCISANQASMCCVKCIYVHFSSDMSSRETGDESRFAFECKSMKNLLVKAEQGSMILMDESFSGTSSIEGAAVAAQVLRHICYRGCFCIYSTHIHEIVAYIDELNKKYNCVMPMCVGIENGNRSYKIIFGETDELSHAYDIAAKYGLEFIE